MQLRLVLLAADTFPTNVSVFTPSAADQLDFFTKGSTDGAGFQHVGNHVPGVTPPSFHDCTFFPDFLELFVAQHIPLPQFN
jgi:hypothetical protein